MPGHEPGWRGPVPTDALTVVKVAKVAQVATYPPWRPSPWGVAAFLCLQVGRAGRA
jgi:hypothetical protein